MKALITKRFGHPEKVLEVQEVPKPEPTENEVLIRIKYTAINDYDWSMVSGKPYPLRLLFGLFKPKNPIPGMELSGVVEACGPGASRFKVGDAVYGDISEYGFGTFAEYIAIHENAILHKPESLSFEDAASLSHAANLASQGLIELGHIKEGMNVLLNGAGGGVGTLGFQIAKTFNTTITGVDTGEKLKVMEELGFDHIIDYKKQDFTRNGKQYDLILDARSTRSPRAYKRALTKDGLYVTVGGTVPRLLQLFISNKLFGNKQLKIVGLKANQDFEYLHALIDKGKLQTIIDGPYPFNETPKRIQYFGDALHHGKVLIEI